MRRLPTTLTKLSDLEARLAEDAAALAKKRAALVRQRDRLERQAQQAHLIAVGKLVQRLGFETCDLGDLEATLKMLAGVSLPLGEKKPVNLRVPHGSAENAEPR